jgi:hypothetical protein
MTKRIDVKPGEAMYIASGGRTHKTITFSETNPLTPVLAQGLLGCKRLAVEPLGVAPDYKHLLIRDLFARSKKLQPNSHAIKLMGGRHTIHGPVAVVCRCDWEDGLEFPIAAAGEAAQHQFALDD